MKKKKKDQAFLQGNSVAVSSDSTMKNLAWVVRMYVQSSPMLYIHWMSFHGSIVTSGFPRFY